MRAWLFIFGLGVCVAAQSPPASVPMDDVRVRVYDSNHAPVGGALVALFGAHGGLWLSQDTTLTNGTVDFYVARNPPYVAEVSWQGAHATSPPQFAEADLVVNLPTHVPAPPMRGGTVISVNDLAAPPRAQDFLRQARAAWQAHHPDRALTLVNQAIAAAPAWGQPRGFRGEMRLATQPTAAAADLQFAIAADPRNGSALAALGRLYHQQGNNTLASTWLHRAVALPLPAWATYFELANLDLSTGDYPEALLMARHAATCQPPAPPEAHLLGGEAAFAAQLWAPATSELQLYLRASASLPATPQTTANRALARLRLAAIPGHQP